MNLNYHNQLDKYYEQEYHYLKQNKYGSQQLQSYIQEYTGFQEAELFRHFQ